jgi:hypothetical protein
MMSDSCAAAQGQRCRSASWRSSRRRHRHLDCPWRHPSLKPRLARLPMKADTPQYLGLVAPPPNLPRASTHCAPTAERAQVRQVASTTAVCMRSGGAAQSGPPPGRSPPWCASEMHQRHHPPASPPGLKRRSLGPAFGCGSTDRVGGGGFPQAPAPRARLVSRIPLVFGEARSDAAQTMMIATLMARSTRRSRSSGHGTP